MERADEGRIRFALCVGGNLYGSNPDATFAKAAHAGLEMIVYLNTTLNTGHAHGLAEETIILPVLARDEEPQPTTQESMFNYVRMSYGGPARHVGPKSEVEVIATIAQQVGAAVGQDDLILPRGVDGFRIVVSIGGDVDEFPGRGLLGLAGSVNAVGALFELGLLRFLNGRA